MRMDLNSGNMSTKYHTQTPTQNPYVSVCTQKQLIRLEMKSTSSCNIVLGKNLKKSAHVIATYLKIMNQLSKVFNRVDIVMGRWAD